ncbi:hypothetical protein [Sinanaerobacter chloroacetimidivorans]|jgi:hypothetical protein|uniref:Uncharacterized protein n=1 Tax=Sinanaerobacter chloroacetimidivorans TaxID=2818044 RepID=A0A8J8B041_9FIRM|nr:hypothetical protein [Sinanaerobacter chloroacetimidivorans]MBR0597188.1 hypothetical protein [Sinanaerobacter chloroacetimidivorans]
MSNSYNRDNFERLGIDKKDRNMDKVMEYALGEHETHDKETDTKKPQNK